MQLEVNINKDKLIKKLKTFYEFHVINLEFIPVGMSSSVYKIITSDNQVYCLKIFLRIKKGTYKFDRFIQEGLGTKLLHDNGFKNLPYPIKTKSGDLWFEFEDKPCLLYSFIEGKRLNEVKLNEKIVMNMATVLAQQHNIGESLANVEIEKRDYAQNFKKDFDKIYNFIEKKEFKDNEYKNNARKLYLENKEIIYNDLEYFEKIQNEVKNCNRNKTITHGDLNFSNILINSKDEPYIIDWEDITIAERERDLYFFTKEQEELFEFEEIFFDIYTKNCEEIILNPIAFAYNILIWDIGERQDWAERLFLEDYSLEQNKLDLVKAEIYVRKDINKDQYIEKMNQVIRHSNS